MKKQLRVLRRALVAEELVTFIWRWPRDWERVKEVARQWWMVVFFYEIGGYGHEQDFYGEFLVFRDRKGNVTGIGFGEPVDRRGGITFVTDEEEEEG